MTPMLSTSDKLARLAQSVVAANLTEQLESWASFPGNQGSAQKDETVVKYSVLKESEQIFAHPVTRNAPYSTLNTFPRICSSICHTHSTTRNVQGTMLVVAIIEDPKELTKIMDWAKQQEWEQPVTVCAGSPPELALASV